MVFFRVIRFLYKNSYKASDSEKYIQGKIKKINKSTNLQKNSDEKSLTLSHFV